MLKEIQKLQKNLVLFNISGGQKCGGGIVSNFNLIKFREVDPKGSTLKSMKNHPGSQKEKVSFIKLLDLLLILIYKTLI